MAPKTQTQPAKLASILSYFHRSGVAHSIKDLEKALPSVASVNSMQVKDYLSALLDENQIKSEKIGSGNWYWSFAGEERRAKETERDKAQKVKDEVLGEVEALRANVEGNEQRQAEEDGEEKQLMLKQREALIAEVEMHRKELEQYKDSDPVELERQQTEVEEMKQLAIKWTDQVQSMESYLLSLGMDKASLIGLKQQTYGDEFDEEEGGLREI